MGTILKVKSGGSFISVPAIIGPQGPQGPAGPQGTPGDVSDVLVNGNSVVSSGIATINIIDLVYPIGSIYMSVNGVNPGSLLGGTWVPWGTGKVPIGIDTTDADFNTVEKTGGSKSHAHSQSSTGGSDSLTSGGPSNNTSGGPSNNTSGSPSNNTSGGSSASDTGSTVLKIEQIPSHSHAIYGRNFFKYTANDTYAVRPEGDSSAWVTQTGSTGGGQGHTHPMSHTHSLSSHTHSLSSHTHGLSSHTHTISSHTHTNPDTNSSSSLQPYITCYMWKRTA